MHERLRAARDLVGRIRFSGDLASGSDAGGEQQALNVRNHFYQSALRLTPEVTPALYRKLSDVYSALEIPAECVEAFVSSSPEIQAQCFTGATTACVIRFSSALVDVLDEDEFAFVAGHELGHFLLRHGHAGEDEQSLEHFMIQRAQEVSADRCGLLACRELSVAIKALMKTISGLNSHHLRFDIGTFVAQLRRLNDPSRAGFETATHPSILVRCRALLWFSMEGHLEDVRSLDPQLQSRLDERVQADLDKYVNGPALQRIAEAKQDLGMWMAASAMLQDGKFARSEQAAFASLFGDEMLGKLKRFLADASVADVKGRLPAIIRNAEDELRQLVPRTAEAEITQLRRRVATIAM